MLMSIDQYVDNSCRLIEVGKCDEQNNEEENFRFQGENTTQITMNTASQFNDIGMMGFDYDSNFQKQFINSFQEVAQQAFLTFSSEKVEGKNSLQNLLLNGQNNNNSLERCYYSDPQARNSGRQRLQQMRMKQFPIKKNNSKKQQKGIQQYKNSLFMDSEEKPKKQIKNNNDNINNIIIKENSVKSIKKEQEKQQQQDIQIKQDNIEIQKNDQKTIKLKTDDQKNILIPQHDNSINFKIQQQEEILIPKVIEIKQEQEQLQQQQEEDEEEEKNSSGIKTNNESVCVECKQYEEPDQVHRQFTKNRLVGILSQVMNKYDKDEEDKKSDSENNDGGIKNEDEEEEEKL